MDGSGLFNHTWSPSADGVRGPVLAESARRIGATPGQVVVWLSIIAALTVALAIAPATVARIVVLAVGALFLLVAAWRGLLIGLSAGRSAPPTPLPDHALPRYTVVAALHDEADIVGQLIERLARIDYPPDRLEGFLVLEAHDHATIAAARVAARPGWMHILVAPPGVPQTKPRALNFALSRAGGDLLTVYDAEDQPDPLQLREAAARFAAPGADRLACLQAPLRIRTRPDPTMADFLRRQFALEYAALFEVVLPGMARLGLPFPLGGTSNHFRVEVLRAVDGWDPWNVTEDADLGFRLWRRGWRMGVIDRPTLETPPGAMAQWLPQRTRWIKGYLQTFGVHTRRLDGLGPRGAFALFVSLGVGLASAALHGPAALWLAGAVLVAGLAGLVPAVPPFAVMVMVAGMAAALWCCAAGARRAGLRLRLRDFAGAPVYWGLLSLAFVHAAWRLAREPFAWDKTPHRPDNEAPETRTLDETAPERLSAAHAAKPQPVA